MTTKQFKLLTNKITKALTRAVHNAIQDHLQRGNPVYVMKGGRIVAIHSRKRQNSKSSVVR